MNAKSIRLEGLVLIEIERRVLILMTLSKICAQGNLCKSVKEACCIFSFGFAPSMANGFHIIPGAEGWKDTAATLNTHIEKAPDVGGWDRCGWGDSGWVLSHSFFLFVLLSFGVSCPLSFLIEYSMIAIVSVCLLFVFFVSGPFN